MQKSLAQLTDDLIAEITSKSAPDSIDTPDLSVFVQNILDSYFNKLDGIKCQFPSIPAAFTGIITTGTVGDPLTGDQLNDILFKFMTYVNELSEAVLGGVQGRIGEFLANVTPETLQAIAIITDVSPSTTYKSAGLVNFVNDKDGGSFDNGNNYLIKKFIVPSGFGAGHANVKFTTSGAVLELIDDNTQSDTTLKLVITKNGAILASSNEIVVASTDTAGAKYYLTDFNTGNVLISSVATSDVFAVELYEKAVSLSSTGVVSFRAKLTNGLFYNELI